MVNCRSQASEKEDKSRLPTLPFCNVAKWREVGCAEGFAAWESAGPLYPQLSALGQAT